jgi:hypothetical protein
MSLKWAKRAINPNQGVSNTFPLNSAEEECQVRKFSFFFDGISAFFPGNNFQ